MVQFELAPPVPPLYVLQQMMPNQDRFQATTQSMPTSQKIGRQGGLMLAYIYGVLLPVCVQLPAIMMWSFLPMSKLLAGEKQLPMALREAAIIMWGPLGILTVGFGLISVPFATAHVLCARVLHRCGASQKKIFFLGLLNPCTALLLIIAGLRAILEFEFRNAP